MLEAVRVSKKYGREAILDGVSFAVQEGESLAITGLSGSGKSTLLSILGSLLRPTVGEVVFQGQNLSSLSDNEKSRLRNDCFGFIFQHPQLIGSLSVLDNVLVPARLARKNNFEKRAKEVLHEMGLQDRLTYLPHQLSIGQKRRAAIARAILLDPPVVFADEPTNDLDPGLAGWVGDFLFGLPGKGKTLVIVTHDVNLAKKALKTARITDGHLVSDYS